MVVASRLERDVRVRRRRHHRQGARPIAGTHFLVRGIRGLGWKVRQQHLRFDFVAKLPGGIDRVRSRTISRLRAQARARWAACTDQFLGGLLESRFTRYLAIALRDSEEFRFTFDRYRRKRLLRLGSSGRLSPEAGGDRVQPHDRECDIVRAGKEGRAASGSESGVACGIGPPKRIRINCHDLP